MASFRYTAITSDGAKKRGVLDVASHAAALAELDRRSLRPIEVEEHAGSAGKLPVPGMLRKGRVPAPDLALAYTQVGDLILAGVPLLRSLQLIGRRKTSPGVARVFAKLAEEVEDGEELASAMARSPEAFRPIHIAMIRAGEKGGFLEASLHRLGEFVQHQVELRRKIIGASIYPAAIASVGLLIMLGLFLFFIPIFRQQFSDVDLPGLTKLLFAVSDLVRNAWWVGPLLVVLLSAAWGWFGRSPRVRSALSRALLRTPKLGKLLRDLAVARVCRVLGTLLASGVPVLQALRIAKDAAGFESMERVVDEATDAVRSGEALAEPLRRSGLFPDDIVEMIAVAEEANNLDTVLVSVADTVDGRVDRLLTTLVRLIEPLLLVAIAAGIVVVALGLILAMMRLTSTIPT